MKILLLSIGLCIFLQVAQSQDKSKSDRSNLKFKGNVKSVTEYQIIDGKKILIESIKFNPIGMIDEHRERYGNGEIIKHVQHYDDKGRLVEKITFEEDGALKNSENYTFNGSGNLILITFRTESSSATTTIRYDEKNRIIEKVIFNPDYTISYKEKYNYDANGNQIEYTKIERQPPHETTTSYTYNNENKKLTYSVDGALLQKISYTPFGEVAQEDDYTPQGIYQHNYTYDQNNNLISYVVLHDGIEVAQEVSDYRNGIKVKRTNFNFSNRTGSEYKAHVIDFDKLGNIINDISYSPDGDITEEHQCIYSDKGIIKKSIYQTNPGKNYVGVANINVTKYNATGNEIETIKQDSKGIVSSKNITVYDSWGNWIKKFEVKGTNNLEVDNHQRVIVYFQRV